MGGARRLRVRVPPGAALRHARPHLQPHLRAGARYRGVPAQSVRPALRGDLRFRAHQGEPPRRGGLAARVAEGPRLHLQPRRLRDPRRDPRGPAGSAVHHPHAFARRHGGRLAREGAAADDADGDALLESRLPRLRRRGARDGRAQAAARQPGRGGRDAASQPRHAGGRQERRRGLQQHVSPRARLPRTAPRAGGQRQGAAAARGGDREDQSPLPAGSSPADGTARVAGDAAPRRPHRSVLQDVAPMHVVERFAAWAEAWRKEPIPAEVLHHARRALIDWHAALLPGSMVPPATLLEKALGEEFARGTPRALALVNGTAAHTVEVDDIYRDGIYHPGAPTIAAALAVNRENPLRAIIVGYEISTRIGAAMGRAHYRYWHNTGTIGCFGAGAAAAAALNLDQKKFAHALATVATFAAGLQQA